MAKGRQVDQRIIKPLTRDLNAFKDYFTWDYCNDKKEILPKKQLKPINYSTIEKLYVKIKWEQYPDLNKLIELKEKHNSKK